MNFFSKRITIFQLARIILLLTLFFSFFPMHLVNADSSVWTLKFDGIDDYVSLGKTEDVLGGNWNETKSINMWINPTGEAQVCDMADVAFCDQIIVNQPHFFGIARGIIEGRDRIWVWNYSSTGEQKIGIQYTPGEWINVSFVHANNTLKAYRNGNLIGQIASGRTDIDPGVITTDFLLGAFYKPELIQAYEGLIDEVRIYSTELSQQTIIDTLRTTLVGNEAGLVAYYQMSNGSGQVLTDDSINFFDGTLLDGINPGSDVLYPQWVQTEIWEDPIANDQNVSVNEDSSNAITLTGSPVTPDAPLTFYLVDSPTHGDLSGIPPNLTYTPDGNYNGPDSFTFYVTEGTSLVSGNATVAIDVIPVNDAPVAEDDSYSVNSGSILTINIATGVLSNDNDIDEDTLSAVLVDDVLHGELILNSDGSFTYDPDPSYFGTDQFTYKADDGDLQSGETVVEITVVQTNFPLYLPFILK